MSRMTKQFQIQEPLILVVTTLTCGYNSLKSGCDRIDPWRSFKDPTAAVLPGVEVSASQSGYEFGPADTN